MSIRRRTPRNYPDKRIAGLKREEKLTIEDVGEIRRRYRHHSRDANCRVLAAEFGVSTTTIHNIVREKKWRLDDWYFEPRSSEKRNIPRAFLRYNFNVLENCYQSLIELNASDAELLISYDKFQVWKTVISEEIKREAI